MPKLLLLPNLYLLFYQAQKQKILSARVLTVSKGSCRLSKWVLHGGNEQNVVIEELHNHPTLILLTAAPDFRIVDNERLS